MELDIDNENGPQQREDRWLTKIWPAKVGRNLFLTAHPAKKVR